jgi:hypothetical protein
MAGLIDAPARFRIGGVGIDRGDQLVHMAPPASVAIHLKVIGFDDPASNDWWVISDGAPSKGRNPLIRWVLTVIWRPWCVGSSTRATAEARPLLLFVCGRRADHQQDRWHPGPGC